MFRRMTVVVTSEGLGVDLEGMERDGRTPYTGLFLSRKSVLKVVEGRKYANHLARLTGSILAGRRTM